MTKHWLNTDPVRALLTDQKPDPDSAWCLRFMLSADTPEQVATRFGGPRSDYVGVSRVGVTGKVPSGHVAVPSVVEPSPTGGLRIAWPSTNGEVLYPDLDAKSVSSPAEVPRSFALWAYEVAAPYVEDHYFYSKFFGINYATPRRVMYVIGSVGEKWSGADLEFEGLSEWKHGRPLYLPGNQLELPLQLLRAQAPVITGNPPLGLTGRSYVFRPQAHYVGRHVHWEIAGGALPAGLELDAATGTVSGTPVVDGTLQVTLRATGESGEARRSLTISVGEARFWCITVTANNGSDQYIALQEVEWRVTRGGPDVTSPSTPIRGASYSTGWLPSATVDNDLSATDGRTWLSPHRDLSAQRLEYDLGKPSKVVELALWPFNHTLGPSTAPRDFSVQASLDGIMWTEVVSFKDVTDWVRGAPKVFSLA